MAMHEKTAEDALDSLFKAIGEDSRTQAAEIGGALMIALREIIELQKLLNEHTHDVSAGMRGIKSSDFETPMSADDQFYGQSHEYKIMVVRQRDFEIVIEALERIAAFDPGITGSLYVNIATDALRRIGRELPESDSEGDENDG